MRSPDLGIYPGMTSNFVSCLSKLSRHPERRCLSPKHQHFGSELSAPKLVFHVRTGMETNNYRVVLLLLDIVDGLNHH